MTVAISVSPCPSILDCSLIRIGRPAITVSSQVYCIVSGMTTPSRPIQMETEIRMDKTTSGWMSGFIGRAHLQRVTAGDAGGGAGFRPGLPDRRRAPSSRVCWRSPCCWSLSREAAGAGRSRLARHRRARCRRRLSAADRAGAEAHHLGPFDRLHRAVAAGNGDLRRAARRRTSAPGVLAVLVPWQRAGGRLRPGARHRRRAGRATC